MSERVALGQSRGDPVIAPAGEHHGTDALLLEDHVALNGLRGLVLPELLDAIGARRVLADHFEHDDRIVGDAGIRIGRRAGDQSVRIPHLSGGQYLHVRARTVCRACRRGAHRATLRRLNVIRSCAIVPPVIATGWKPSNSKRSSWRDSHARNSATVIGLRSATFIYCAGTAARCFAISSSHGPGNRPRFTTSGANTLSWRGHFSRGSSYDTSSPLPSGSRK